MKFSKVFLFGALISAGMSCSEAAASGPEVYQKHCAVCHHPERYGLTGPPLIPEYFGIKKEKELSSIIAQGLEATNMPGFKDTLSPDEIRDVVAFIRTPAVPPAWGEKEMLSTWRSEPETQKSAPAYDMENFFMIVEGGTGKVHFMDGDTFRLLDSVKAGAIHGGPKFDKALKHAFMVSRDGWVIKYDFAGMQETGRIRTGISARNIAVSSDSAKIAAATLLPEALVILDASTMKPVRSFTGIGSVSSVYSLKKSGRFVAALKDRAELLLIDEKSLATTKIGTEEPLTDFFIEPEERYIIGTSRKGDRITIVDLEKAAVVKTLNSGIKMPHLASAALWKDGSSVLAAFPHIGEASVSVLKLYDWELVTSIKTKGPGFFARTHEYIPHIWVDTGTDTIQLIDKKTFKVTNEVVPEAGKKAMHVEFTKEGSFALVSVWEDDGAVKIYDTRAFKEVKTLPFKKPVGKYNATNKKF